MEIKSKNQIISTKLKIRVFDHTDTDAEGEHKKLTGGVASGISYQDGQRHIS